MLPNGLELVVIPDHRAPVVTHMIWYKVGSADETAGKSGLAHFLEHLMFKGTAKHPVGQFSKIVASIGGQENAFTSSDYTGYFQRVPTEQLKAMMELEADRMTGLQLTDEVVLPERNVILEEQNQRIGNNPRAQLGEQIDAALFLNHPYGRPVIGWRHEMEQLSRDDALKFYRRFYGPNGAVVVIAGDVEPEQARKFAEETYGKVKRNDTIVAPRVRPQEPPPVAVRSLTLADARVEQPLMQRSYLVPSFANAQRGESEALEVLAHILGSGSNSRLYRTLAVDKPVAVSAGAGYDSSVLDMSKFTIYGSPRPGVTLQQFETESDAVIAELILKGITADELDRAKSRLIADAVYAQDNQATMARWYGSALMTGATVQDVQKWPDRIRAVTAAEVQDAARKWLDKRRSVTGYLIKDTSPQAEKRS
jgi:zinc protease